ncbi:MAG: hypothetical protein ILA34_00810 [Bacteroidaceae bacterium]|nr:hypothetical protein [Bacteroidaceae bacterium]
MKHLLMLASLLILMAARPALAQADSVAVADEPTAITVVSDTTDTADDAAETVIDQDDDMWGEAWSWADDIPGGLRDRLFSALSGTVGLGMVLIILFLLFLPLILVGLIIYLIVRGNRRRPAPLRPSTAGAAPTADGRNGDAYEWRQQQKEQAVIHGAVALGVAVFCWLYGWKLMMGLSIIFLCYNVGRYYNAHRAQKRMDDGVK